jgi:hypothetical protein
MGIIVEPTSNQKEKHENGWSQNYLNWNSFVHELCKETLEKIRNRMPRYWNRGKKEPPTY